MRHKPVETVVCQSRERTSTLVQASVQQSDINQKARQERWEWALPNSARRPSVRRCLRFIAARRKHLITPQYLKCRSLWYKCFILPQNTEQHLLLQLSSRGGWGSCQQPPTKNLMWRSNPGLGWHLWVGKQLGTPPVPPVSYFTDLFCIKRQHWAPGFRLKGLNEEQKKR